MLDFASFQHDNKSLGQKFLVWAINALFAILLVLPLAALVVVLLWRIAMLWITIAISPFLVLKEVFSDLFGGIKGEKWMDFFDVKEIVKLLMAPVLIALAISMSLLFMSVLKTSLSPNGPYMITLKEDKSNQKEYEAALAKYSQQMKEVSGMELTYTG